MNIIVTGASRGIGRELVKILALDGHNVLALSRSEKELASLSSNPGSIIVGVFDLTAQNMQQELEKILEEVGFGSWDVLVNNAGNLVNKLFGDLTLSDIQSCYQVNVIGVMQLMQVVLPKMNPDLAHCLNISSMGGFQGTAKFAGLSAYSSSKAAVASLTECLAEEYKESNIKFNCLALGAVQTEMLNQAFPGYQAPLSAAQMAGYVADFALNGHQYYNGKILPVSLSTP